MFSICNLLHIKDMSLTNDCFTSTVMGVVYLHFRRVNVFPWIEEGRRTYVVDGEQLNGTNYAKLPIDFGQIDQQKIPNKSKKVRK